MTVLLHAELLKLRTTRTFVALIGIAVVTSVLSAGLVSILTEPTRDSVLVDVFASDTSSFFILILAVIGISGEWRHRTITSSLLAAPDRLRFLAAKAVAYAAAGVVVSAAIAVAVSLVGTVILSVRHLPLPTVGDVAGQAGRNLVVAALLGGLGVAVGGLLRNQIVAVIALFVVMLLVEPLVVALAPDYGRWGPLGVLPMAAAGLPPEATGVDNVELPSVPIAILALLGWIALAFAAASTLLIRRDLE
jgi:ABC-type transport system involved in multi-copper enzyme maturation permease subunit